MTEELKQNELKKSAMTLGEYQIDFAQALMKKYNFIALEEGENEEFIIRRLRIDTTDEPEIIRPVFCTLLINSEDKIIKACVSDDEKDSIEYISDMQELIHNMTNHS